MTVVRETPGQPPERPPDQPPGQPKILNRTGGATIAFHTTQGRSPGVVFLGGFRSDMTGTKAMALEAACKDAGRAFTRFDYFGHGASSGDFTDGTIGRWREDAIAVLDELTEGPQVLVGSSMGGWIMLLAALARPGRVHALVGIAAAPDFTEDLMWDGLDERMKAALQEDGIYHVPSEYGEEAYPITWRLIEEGRDHLLLRAPIALRCPVRLIHGLEDPDVPWDQSLRLARALEGPDVTVTLVKDAVHRLAEPRDIARLIATVEEVCGLF
ncbi:MAG: alpha/beta hydrolase [Proteobacteria bacterium]|nr:alpha/beta hydrolase [Pseudomonadota bacterium]